jgi:hypothetical protein
MMSGVIGVPLGMFLSTKLKVGGHHIPSHESMTFWYGSESGSMPLTIFGIDLQDVNRIII